MISLTKQVIQTHWKSTFKKALFASLFFLFLTLFQDQNLIREIFEDTAFDIVDTSLISTTQQKTGSDLVTVLAFDNSYMKAQHLYDKNNIATYGYTFPREHIVQAIQRLDDHISKLSKAGGSSICPKAVFIDFDLSYPTGANGELSDGDKQLRDILAKPHCYKILLPKVTSHHIITATPNITFVSPYFHFGSDDVTRRYEPIKTIAGQDYIAAPIALWQLIKYGKTNLSQARRFPDHAKRPQDNSHKVKTSRSKLNVNANMIWIKNYDKSNKPSEAVDQSYWQQLRRISLTYPLKDTLSFDRIDQQTLLIGGTDRENPYYKPSSGDYHNILKVINPDSMSGVDLHANTLMTLLHLSKNKPNLPIMQQVHWATATAIIFISFVMIDLFIAMLLQYFAFNSEQTHLILTFTLNTILLFSISLFFLQLATPQWFNWIGVLILFELIEGILLTRRYLPLLLNWLLVKILIIIKQQLPALLKWIYRKIMPKKHRRTQEKKYEKTHT